MKRGLPFALLSILTIASFVLAGCQAATASPTPESGPEVISAENVGDLAIVDRIGRGDIYGSALSPDGKTLAISTASGVYLFDETTLEQIDFIDLPYFPKSVDNSKNNLSFNTDGTLLAISYEVVFIWSLPERKIVNIIDDLLYSNFLGFASFNTLLIMEKPDAVFNENCDDYYATYKLYNTTSSQAFFTWSVCRVALHFRPQMFVMNNENIVLIGNPVDDMENLHVLTIDPKTGKPISDQVYNADQASIAPDGTRLLIGNPQSSTLIDPATGQVISEIEGLAGFLPASDSILLSQTGNTWSILDENLQPVCSLPSGFSETFDFSTNYGTIYDHLLPIINSASDEITIWDLSNCKKTIIINNPTFNSFISSIEEKSFFVNNRYQVYQINDEEISRIINNVFMNEGRVNFLFDRSSSSIISVSNFLRFSDNIVRYWNIPQRKIVDSFGLDSDFITQARINNTGQYIALQTIKDVIILDLDSKEEVGSFSIKVDDFLLLPDSENICFIIGNLYYVVNFRDHKLISRTELNQSPTDQNSYFSADGNHIVSETPTGLIIWGIDGRLLITLEEYRGPISYNNDYVTGEESDIQNSYRQWYVEKAFSDYYVSKLSYIEHITNVYISQYIAIGEYEQKGSYGLRIWNMQTGKKIRDINLPFKIDDFRVSEDCRSIYTSTNGLVYVWQILESD